MGYKRSICITMLLVMLIFTHVPRTAGDSDEIDQSLRLTSPQGIYYTGSGDRWIRGSSIISVNFPELADKELTLDLIVWNLSDNVSSYNTRLLIAFTKDALDLTQVRNVILEGGEYGEEKVRFETYKTELPRLYQFRYWIEDVYDEEGCVGYVDEYTVGEIGPEQSTSLKIRIEFGSFPTNELRLHFDVYGFTASVLNGSLFPNIRNSKWDDVTLMYASLMPYIPEYPLGAIVPMAVTILAAGVYIYLKRLRVKNK